MSNRFYPCGLHKEFFQIIQGCAVPERGLHVNGQFFIEKARPEPAVRGKPEPVAGTAKVLAYGAYETDGTFRATDPIRTGRSPTRPPIPSSHDKTICPSSS